MPEPGNEGAEGWRRIEEEAIDVVLDHRQAMLAQNGGDCLTTLRRHGGAGGILQRGHAVERARRVLATGRFERIGEDSLIVLRHASDAQREQLGDGADAGIGERLRQHDIARPQQGAEANRQSVLGAGGDDDPIGRHR